MPATTLRRLEETDAAPSLTELAAYFGLSPHHFHRAVRHGLLPPQRRALFSLAERASPTWAEGAARENRSP
jgi:hypothetical protein